MRFRGFSLSLIYLLFLFLFGFPNIAFHNVFCTFLFRPAFVVGIPVALAIFLFALVIPKARFQLKPPNDMYYSSHSSLYPPQTPHGSRPAAFA